MFDKIRNTNVRICSFSACLLCVETTRHAGNVKWMCFPCLGEVVRLSMHTSAQAGRSLHTEVEEVFAGSVEEEEEG